MDVGGVYHTADVDPGAMHTSGSYTMLASDFRTMAPAGARSARITVTSRRPDPASTASPVEQFESFSAPSITALIFEGLLWEDGEAMLWESASSEDVLWE